MFVFEQELFEHIEKYCSNAADFSRDVLGTLVGKVQTYKTNKTFIDIEQPKDCKWHKYMQEDEEVQKSEKDQKFNIHAISDISELMDGLTDEVLEDIGILANKLRKVWKRKGTVFICGNGGSAANAIHIANDLHYGTGACGNGPAINGLRVEALPSNAGVMTCLANDIGYERVYSQQISVKGEPRDMLIALSGSGNSANIINAIEAANIIGMESIAILAFGGENAREWLISQLL